MSDIDIVRANLEAALPPGSFWQSKNDFALLLDALAEEMGPFYTDAKKTACIRNVETTNLILDLADEYGVDVFSDLLEAEIRAYTAAAKKGVKEPGAGDLQSALNTAGFDVQVHRNGPTPTSPFTYLGEGIPFMVDGNESSVDGNENAIDGEFEGGEILVNGPIAATLPIYSSVDGHEDMVDGNENAVDGYFTETADFEYQAVLPLDQSRWNNIYFIGGDVTRDPITGEITNIEQADVPADRKTEFETQILKYGPGEGWAGLIINYV